MAEDGTGGIVYRKRVDGRAHIFAAQLFGGRWRAAAAGRRRASDFDSSWPAIAAGDGGRLVVTWVQEFGAGTRPALLGVARSRRVALPAAARGRPQRRRGEQHASVARDEPGWQRLPRLPGPDRGRLEPDHHPRLPRHGHQGRALQRLAVERARLACRPQPVRPGAGGDRGELAEDRHRRGRQRPGRVPGARRGVRRPGLGAARLRHDVRHSPAGQPATVRRRTVARAGRCVLARRVRLRTGRGRLPPATRTGLGARRPARVREHDPRGVQRHRGQVRHSAAGRWHQRRCPVRHARRCRASA